jgi:hypothetical protein
MGIWLDAVISPTMTTYKPQARSFDFKTLSFDVTEFNHG